MAKATKKAPARAVKKAAPKSGLTLLPSHTELRRAWLKFLETECDFEEACRRTDEMVNPEPTVADRRELERLNQHFNAVFTAFCAIRAKSMRDLRIRNEAFERVSDNGKWVRELVGAVIEDARLFARDVDEEEILRDKET